MSQLSVRNMTAVEYAEWAGELARGYADEQVAAGNWPAEDALELALAENAKLLPDGAATEDMLLLTAVDAEGARVGVLWISLVNPRGTPDCAYIYDIEVREEHRGRGFGRALLTAAEETVLAHGVGSLMLNVFGHNGRAVGLYSSSGYEVVTQQMRKSLAEGAPTEGASAEGAGGPG